MSQYLLFALLGLAPGAVYAALGLGLAVTYRGTGVVNFGYGAIGMAGCFVYVNLRNTGSLELPVPGIAIWQVSNQPLGAGPSMAIALAFAAVLGYLCHALVFYPLRSAPVLTKVVASVGVMVLLQAVAVVRYGSEPATVTALLPSTPVQVVGQQIPIDRFLLPAIIAVATIVLWAAFRFLRIGLAMRAAAENELGAALLGWSPNRLGIVTWIVSSVLATLIGILIAPLTSLTPATFTLTIVPALAAAVVGRFTSFFWILIAGLLIGITESLISPLQAALPILAEATGLQDVIPLLVIVGALLIGGERLPGRGNLEVTRLPLAPPSRRLLPVTLATAGGVVVLLVLLHGGWRYSLVVTMVTALLCLSLVVATGYTGQIVLAQLPIAGLTSFVLAIAVANWGLPFPLGPIVAVIVGSAIGVLFGLPALRFRGVNLAITTLALAFAANSLLFQSQNFTGGQDGRIVKPPRLFGIDFGISAGDGDFRLVYCISALAIVSLVFVGVGNLRRSETGRRFLAVRANERAASSLGINVATTKLTAFALSAAIAALAGVLTVYNQIGGRVSFDGFDALTSVSIVAFAYLGGIGRLSGAVIGGTLGAGSFTFYALAQWWSGFNNYSLVIGGLALIVTAVRNPEGIAGAHSLRLAWPRAAQRHSARPAPAAVDPVAVTTAVARIPLPEADSVAGGQDRA
ncbi:ABC transporter permease [Pseudonocardia sp.]|uniref:ABC transporter permease n=1 Tax=Pseudonocardia sp. TaxID=60912 RepID=UPI0031FC979C